MSQTLNQEEKAVSYETMRHIERVRNLLNIMIIHILERQEMHDQSKMESPEVEIITERTKDLAPLSFGSPEYEAQKKEMKVSIEHHYAHNRHHPEHFKNGIKDMNLIDLLEMFCDWKAASERHNDGNLRKSIEINAERFGMSLDLAKIFENSMELL